MHINRRELLRVAAASGLASLAAPLAAAFPQDEPILDCHIHLFDPRRPGGIPWPLPNDTIYAPALPDRFAQVAEPQGVRGAIAVEASPLAADNDWVLKIAAASPVIVGFIGDLVPGSPQFAQQLDRLHADSLFLGIRYGNLWNRDLAVDSHRPEFLAGLKQLAASQLVLESANPDPPLVAALLRLSQQLPDLRIVIDHLPSLVLPAEPAPREDYLRNLRQLAENPRTFVKLSEIPVRVAGRTRLDLSYYRDHLDQIWDTFGEDRLLFGSDWPNSDHLATYADTLKLVRSYMAAKSNSQRHKFFWSNSISVYRWKPRRSSQQLA